MSSTSTDFDVERPNYSWQKDTLPKSPTTHRTELDIINSDNSPTPKYHIYKHVFGGCFCSPVSTQLTNGACILYVSPNRLEWAKEMSETYPNSQFDCITIGESRPRPEDLPAKIKYGFWNIDEKTPYPDSLFDFIFVESVVVHLRSEEWSNFLLELFRIAKPGSFLELQENDLWRGSMGPTTEVFITTVLYSFRARGVNTRAGRELPDLLKKAGFTNISKFHASLPCGWGSPVGEAYGQFVRGKTEKMAPFVMKSMGWTNERLLEELDKVDREQIKFKTYVNVHKAYAQKP